MYEANMCEVNMYEANHDDLGALLFEAAHCGDKKEVAKIMSAGCINIGRGIIGACSGGHIDIFKYLLNCSLSRPDFPQPDIAGLLRVANRYGHDNITEYLLNGDFPQGSDRRIKN